MKLTRSELKQLIIEAIEEAYLDRDVPITNRPPPAVAGEKEMERLRNNVAIMSDMLFPGKVDKASLKGQSYGRLSPLERKLQLLVWKKYRIHRSEFSDWLKKHGVVIDK